MIVAFKHNTHDNDIIDTFITIWTNSKFIHSQIIFSNGEVGSSWMETGVAIRTIEDTVTYPYLYTFVEVNGLDEQKVYDYIKLHEGETFDMMGSAFPFLNREDKWHCSEILFSALKNGGLKSNMKAHKVYPQHLYDILINRENNY